MVACSRTVPTVLTGSKHFLITHVELHGFNGKDIDRHTGRNQSVIGRSLRVVKAIEHEQLAVPCGQIRHLEMCRVGGGLVR